MNKVISGIAILMALYHLAMARFILELPVLWQNTHLAFALILVFLSSLKKDRRRWWPLTALLILLSLAVTTYVKIEYDRLSEYIGWPTIMDTVIGVIILVLALEGGRRAQGFVFTAIALIFLCYGFFGHFLPYPLWHAPFPPERLINMLTLGFSGVYGSMLSISAKYIFLFMLFAGLLEASGAAASFMPLANALAKRLAGGTAHTAVISSALVGMVTGQGMANVAITGSFTIPAMKRVGYKPEMAAAVEAASSIGGQIMPPVMGAAAFVMVGFTGIPYSRIMLGAIIPALLYFFSIGMAVHLNALKLKLGPSTEEFSWQMAGWRAPVFVIPLSFLTVLLLLGHTPMFSAFYAIISVPIVSLVIGIFKRETFVPISRWIEGIVSGAIAGARIGVGIACIGIVVGVVTFSGLGPKFTVLIRMLSGAEIAIALILTMFLSLLLGCGIPVTAAYILVAVAVVPGLVKMGVDLLSAHMFAFYFACIGAISPPIAGASLVAAAMAEADYFKTGLKAMGLVMAGFIIPYLWVWNPFMLWYSSPLLHTFFVLLSVIGGISGLQILLEGYYLMSTSKLEKILCGLATAAFFSFAFSHRSEIFLCGFILFGCLTLNQWMKKTKRAECPVKDISSNNFIDKRWVR